MEQEMNTDPDYVQVLVALFQYLTIFNDTLVEKVIQETDQIDHNFNPDLIQKVCTIIASTTNSDLLSRASRFVFSIVEMAAETSDPLDKIGTFLAPQALMCLNEGLKQCTVVSFSSTVNKNIAKYSQKVNI
jgi:hypothetical protein